MGKLKVELKVTLKRSLVMPVVARYDNLGPWGAHAPSTHAACWGYCGGDSGGGNTRNGGGGDSGLKRQYVTFQTKAYLFRIHLVVR